MMIHAPRHAPVLIPVTGAITISFSLAGQLAYQRVQISHDNLKALRTGYKIWFVLAYHFLAQALSFDLSVMSIYPARVRCLITCYPNEIINDFRLPQLTIDVWVSIPSRLNCV